VLEGAVQVQRQRIMDGGADAFRLQALQHSIAMGDANDVEVPGVPGDDLRARHRQLAQELVVADGGGGATRVPVGEVRQFDAQDRSLQFVEPAVRPPQRMVILLGRAVIAHGAQALGDLAVVGGHGAAVAPGAQVLAGIEAPGGGASMCPGAGGAMRLAGVFDDGQAQRATVDDAPVKVNGDDGPGARRERHARKIHAEIGVAVDEDGTGAGALDAEGGGDEGEGGSEHLVTRSDTGGAQRQLDGVGAGGHAHRVRAPGKFCEVVFERRQLAAENEVLLLRHASDRRLELRAYCRVLRFQID
jgi:hypothetical protein